ncbi:MAG: hypothetical protein WCL30_02615 [Pseudomonadota bacterium]
MLGIVRNILRDKYDNEKTSLADLHVGCEIGFGLMPQKNISAIRMRVSQVNSYMFAGDNFVAYLLENNQTKVNLIITEDENGKEYLALSMKLPENIFSQLFSVTPENWFSLNVGEEVFTSNRVMGMQQTWFAPIYKSAMFTEGHFLDGDYRLRRVSERLKHAKQFDYTILIDERNNYALEAEKYQDGSLAVFATIYRPVTDIGEITNPGSYMQDKKFTVIESQEESQEENILNEIAVHGKFGRIQPLPEVNKLYNQDALLACDTNLAGKIIAEAQSNQMPLSELIRKVIDLPANSEEQVLIPLALANDEYAELARRYQLPPNDHAGVRDKIIEELKNFLGVR